MRGWAYFGLGLALFCASAWSLPATQSVRPVGSPTEEVSPFEFYIYRPFLPIKWAPSETSQNLNLGAGVTAHGGRGILDAQGMRWEDSVLKVDHLNGAFVTDRLESEISALGITQKLFSFKNVRVDVKSRGEIRLELPQRIRLKLDSVAGKIQFSLVDDDFKNHVDKQIDSLFQAFDQNFNQPTLSGELSDLAREAGAALLLSAKGKLLDQARDEFKKSMTREQLAKSLLMGSQSIPAGLPPEALQGEWVLSRVTAQRRGADGRPVDITLWRLAQVAAPEVGVYNFPASVETRNIFTVVASGKLIQELSRKSLVEQSNSPDKTAPAVVLAPETSALIARLFSFELPPGAKLELLATGRWGPKFKPWVHRVRQGSQSFSDVIWTLREQGGDRIYTLGLVVEYPAGGSPRLKNAFLLGQDGAVPISEVGGLELLRAVTDPKLNALYEKWGTGNAQLKSIGMRSIGLLDETRASGEGFVDQWAQAVGIDFEILKAF